MCVNPKYNIRRRLLEIPGKLLNNKYKLSIELDISERTLDKWMGTEKGKKFSIPSDGLFKLATFFECTERELLNGKA
jgi:hypothetical protein